jgi:hypothetical protein
MQLEPTQQDVVEKRITGCVPKYEKLSFRDSVPSILDVIGSPDERIISQASQE